MKLPYYMMDAVPSLFRLCVEHILFLQMTPQINFDLGSSLAQARQLFPGIHITSDILHALHMFGWFRALYELLPRSRSEAVSISDRSLLRELRLVIEPSRPARLVKVIVEIASWTAYYLIQTPQDHILCQGSYFIIELRLTNHPWRHPEVKIYSAQPHLLFKSDTPVNTIFFGRWHPTNSVAGVVFNAMDVVLLYTEEMEFFDGSIVDTESFPLDSNNPDELLTGFGHIISSARARLYDFRELIPKDDIDSGTSHHLRQ